MIMFFQMFENKLLTKTSLRLFYSILQKTTLKDVILELPITF